MASSVDVTHKPGKCAPRLIEDLLRYDPARATGTHGNILTDTPRMREDGDIVPVDVAPESCRHKFMFKPKQSIQPEHDSAWGSEGYYKIASFCLDCRCHLDLSIDLRSGQAKRPCPNQTFSLHHLRHMSSTSEGDAPAGTVQGERWLEEHKFICSAPRCSAFVKVAIRPPRLGPGYLALLQDPVQIRDRVQRELDKDPERLKGYTVPEPLQVLYTLKRYIDDILRGEQGKRISADNKSFLTTLGEPCRELLEFLGFKYSESEADKYWYLPSVWSRAQAPIYGDGQSVLIDDVEKELSILMDQRPLSERMKTKLNVTFAPVASIKEFQRCLGSLDYATVTSSRRAIDLTTPESPFYAGLGALPDFSDELVHFAYERQTSCDPPQSPLYLTCLQEIAQSRQREISSRDIQQAYSYLGVSPTFDDAAIIGTCQARISDAPRQEHDIRQHLRVIGVARKSEAIQSAAANHVTTYAEALAWLGAEESASDEFIITYLALKVADDADSELGRHAVNLIAEHRDSAALRTWLTTGQLGEVEMSADQAYARLGMEDHTLDDDTVLAAYGIRVSETPSETEDLRAALTAIGKARNSFKIETHMLGSNSGQARASDWPVGLENIGNTCYLNSLLQFYFTVKPLREMILNFDRVEMKVSPETLAQKRVGSRKVSPREIERAKNFVLELRRLFSSLIKANSASITPERELARLTLIKPGDEEVFRRRSTTVGSHGRPQLGEINGVPVQGPVMPGSLESILDVDAEAPPQQHDNVSSDDASEVTLVDPPSADRKDVEMVDAGSDAPTDANDTGMNHHVVELEGEEAEDSARRKRADSNPAEANGESIIEVAPSTVQGGEQSTDQAHDTDAVMTDGDTGAPIQDGDPPERPPPIPPRPDSVETQKPMDELELGAQQDVTEVIGNVLFQLECAMRPKRIDSDGEQIDEIKELFYGQLRAYIDAKGSLRAKEEYFSDIKVNVASGPRDIYAALDGAFDVQEVTIKEGKFPQYTSIAHLPPVLQIQVQRVQYDVQNKKTYKSDAHLHLRETIFLDRYMDTEDEVLLQKRQEAWQWKEEVARLDARRQALLQTEANMSVPHLLHITRDWLSDLQVLSAAEQDRPEQERLINNVFVGDPHTLAALEQVADEATNELDYINTTRGLLAERIERHFDEFRALPYRLAAVFIHRGTATFGHYWIYIYDFRRRIWRKYNDGYVTEVHDTAEIFGGGGASSEGEAGRKHEHQHHQDQQQEQQAQAQPPPQQQQYQYSYVPTPYYLVYVKDEWKEDLIDPVCREVEVDVEPDVETVEPPREHHHDGDDDHHDDHAGALSSSAAADLLMMMTSTSAEDAPHDEDGDVDVRDLELGRGQGGRRGGGGGGGGGGVGSGSGGGRNDGRGINGGGSGENNNEEEEEVAAAQTPSTEMKERSGASNRRAVGNMYWNANRAGAGGMKAGAGAGADEDEDEHVHGGPPSRKISSMADDVVEIDRPAEWTSGRVERFNDDGW